MTKIKKLFRRGKPEELPPLPGFATVCVCGGVSFGLPAPEAIRAASDECTLWRILIFTFD